MDDFEKQLLIVFVVANAIGLPLYYILKKRYIKQGKSIKNLEYKIAYAIVLPIISIPALLTPVIPFWGKALGIALTGIAGWFYMASSRSAQTSFRKILGLPPVDEHTGEVIKKEEQDKK